MTLEGDYLFWLQDNKHMSASERGFYMYNLPEGTRKQLTHQVVTPSISGDRVVFSEKGIMLMNISTGSLVQLTNQDDAVLPVSDLRFNQNPSIDGDRVVWTEHEGLARSSVDGGTIVLLNLTTGERQYLPTGSPGNQSTPMISGNYILWKDYRHGSPNDPELYLFDLKNGKEERLPTENPVESNPYISGNDVVWTEKIHGVHTIVHYAISSRTRTVVGQGSVHQGHLPPVSDDRVVWLQSMNPLDFRDSRSAVMIMDLRTGEKSQITPFKRGLSHPVISGEYIIYTRGEGEDWFRSPREVVLYLLPSRPDVTIPGMDTRPGNSTPSPSDNSQGEVLPPPTPLPGFSCFIVVAGFLAALILWKVRK